MSSISSPGLVASVSASSEPACERSLSAKSSATAVPSSRSDGQVCRVIQMSVGSRQIDWVNALTSSAAGSLVRISALRETAPALPESVADSGASTTDSSKNSVRGGRSSRTSAPFALADWTSCSGNSLRAGMTRNGTAYPLVPLVLLTKGTASGLLPTPCAMPYGSNQGGAAGRVGPVRPSLHTMARRSLWPTPTWRDGTNAANLTAGRRNPDSKHHSGTTLVDFVRMWRTPNASDAAQWSNQSLAERKAKGLQIRLNTQVSPEGGAGGKLNPTWVEWLMGFPLGWTELSPSETPSSRRSRKSSDSQSLSGSVSNE
jgi:hypothetical protein